MTSLDAATTSARWVRTTLMRYASDTATHAARSARWPPCTVEGPSSWQPTITTSSPPDRPQTLRTRSLTRTPTFPFVQSPSSEPKSGHAVTADRACPACPDFLCCPSRAATVAVFAVGKEDQPRSPLALSADQSQSRPWLGRPPDLAPETIRACQHTATRREPAGEVSVDCQLERTRGPQLEARARQAEQRPINSRWCVKSSKPSSPAMRRICFSIASASIAVTEPQSVHIR